MAVSEQKTARRHVVRFEFNDEEWEQVQRGAKWLYADEMISKPTAYRFLKWCGLTFSESLDKKHGGDDN